ncbi:MAG: polymer-forming cytoskeletal protein [Spirochaetes bacterium]|nr:polymer-forming cytoskeletal protein [Spirochaetota bacterium]
MALKGDNANSVIGEGSIFEGRFYISGSLQINGKFEGDIKTEDQIMVGETGKVKTNLSARRVIIAGTLIGNINAMEEVLLLETGRVLGDITTPIIHMNKGVVVQGKINITGGQKKEVKKIIEESYATGPIMPPISSRSSATKSKKKPAEEFE